MQLTLRELLDRLPRYLVMVNPSKIMGDPGEWQSLSAHHTILEALRQCSGYMGERKQELGIQLTSSEADPRIEPWIVIVDRVQSRTVVWITDSQLHMVAGVPEENDVTVAAPKPGEETARVPTHLLHEAFVQVRKPTAAEPVCLPLNAPLPSTT